MAGAVANLMVRAGADFSQLQRSMQQVQGSVSEFHNGIKETFGKIGEVLAAVGLTFGLEKAVEGMKEAAQSAIELEATTQNLNKILGQSSQDFIDWSKTTATSYGYSQVEAERYGASFAHMISLFAKNTDDIDQKTKDLMKSSAIIANGTGRSIDDVMQRIQSGMLGNVQAINDLGIYANQSMLEASKAFQQIANGRHWSQLSMAERQQVIYMSLMEQAAKQYGTTIQDNVHNKLVTFTATMKNVGTALGNAFLPILNRALPILTALGNKLLQIMNIVAQVSQALFGKAVMGPVTDGTNKQTQAINDQTGAVNGLANAHQKLAKAKKSGSGSKTSGNVAGFDEVHTLADKSSAGADTGAGVGSSGGIGNGAGGIGNVGNNLSDAASKASEVSGKVLDFVNKIKNAFAQLQAFLEQHSKLITSVLSGLVAGFATFLIGSNWAEIVEVLTTAFEALSAAITAISVPVLAVAAVVALLVGNMVYLWQTNEKFRDSVISVWNEIASFLTTVVTDTWNIIKAVWDKYGASIVNGLAGFMKSIQNIILNIWDSFLKPFITSALNTLKNLWDDHIKYLVQAIVEFIAKLVDGALQIWDKFISPIVNWLIQKLGPVFAQVFGDIFKIIGKLVGVVADVATGLFKALGGVVDFIVGVFTGNWKKTWTGIQTIFSGIFSSLYAIFKTPLDAINTYLIGPFTKTFKSIFTGFSDIINGVKTTFNGIIEFVTGIFTRNWSKAWKGVKDIFKGVFESLYGYIKTPINWIINGVNTLIKGLDSLSIKIPDWVPGFGGKTWGVNIPRIPRLAQGGIIDKPTIAQIGEAGPEAVVPLENTSFVDKLASALGTAVMNAMSTNKSTGDVVIKLNDIELGRATAISINRAQRVAGKLLLDL